MVDYQGGYAAPRADLGMALEEHRREGGGNWATPKILPVLSVPKKTATFSAYPRATLLLAGGANRSFGGTYNRITYQAKDHTYNCQDYGLEQLVDDKQRAFYGNDFDGDYAAMVTTQGRLRRIQEKRTQALLMSAAAVTAFTAVSTYVDKSATDPWTNVSADIYKAVTDAGELSRAQTGIKPNKMTVSRKVLNLMKENTALQARRNVTILLSDGVMQDYLKDIFELKELIIADEVENTAAENAPAVIADIWPKQYCLLAYVCEDNAPLSEPSLGRLMQWDFLPETSIVSYRAEDRSSDVIRCEHFVQEYIYDYAYGALIKVQV